MRSSKGLSGMNIRPALALLTKPLMDSPLKLTVLATPGCFRAISDIFRMTASVRSRLAPSGNWAKATRYCLSCCGMKPVGVFSRPR
ncbi:hypothetical protein D3C85_1549210 [compost metagenome]